MLDTVANGNVITSSIIGDKVRTKLDGEVEISSAVGQPIFDSSSSNNLIVSELIWAIVDLNSVDNKNRSFDVVLGWPIFEQKVVEIDYENKNVVMHQSMYSFP